MRTRTTRSLLAVRVLRCAPARAPGLAPPRARTRAQPRSRAPGRRGRQTHGEPVVADVTSARPAGHLHLAGSSLGRKNFANFHDDFAITDIPYQGTRRVRRRATVAEPAVRVPADRRRRHGVQLPHRGGGQADEGPPALRRDDHEDLHEQDHQLERPGDHARTTTAAAAPTCRSSRWSARTGSGTTAQFTTWMNASTRRSGRPFAGGPRRPDRCKPEAGAASSRPPGSDQVMNSIAAGAGNGTIGYVEYSYALNAQFPVVKCSTLPATTPSPTQYNVAVALTKAQIKDRPRRYLTQVLDGVYSNTGPAHLPAVVVLVHDPAHRRRKAPARTSA